MSGDEFYDEKELLQKVALGDEAAFARLFHAWRDKLYFFTLKFTQSPQQSEDLVQDVFVKLWLHREQLSEISNFSAWIYRVIKNQAISALRKIALETTLMAELKKEAVAGGQPVEEELFHKQLQQKLMEVIEQLPPRQKQIYTLTRMEGMKQEEVAKLLGISLSTVQNHMTEALRKLKSTLLKDYPAISLYVVWMSIFSIR